MIRLAYQVYLTLGTLKRKDWGAAVVISLSITTQGPLAADLLMQSLEGDEENPRARARHHPCSLQGARDGSQCY